MYEMLGANEACKLATEKAEERVKKLLKEIEAAIIEECENGRRCVTWEAWHVPEQTRSVIAHELRMLGYRVSSAPNSSLFIRW